MCELVLTVAKDLSMFTLSSVLVWIYSDCLACWLL